MAKAPLSVRDFILYEVTNSWWTGYVSWGFLQALAGKYYAWKAGRQYVHYLKVLGFRDDRYRRAMDVVAPGVAPKSNVLDMSSTKEMLRDIGRRSAVMTHSTVIRPGKYLYVEDVEKKP